MTDCAKIREELSAYLDNELAKEERSLIGDHIKSCASCAAELDSLRRYADAAASLKGIKAPEGFLASVRERIGRRSGFKEVIRILFVPFYIKLPIEAAAVAASVLLILTVFKGSIKQPLEYAGNEEVPAPRERKFDKVAIGAVGRDEEKSLARKSAALSEVSEYPIEGIKKIVSGVGGAVKEIRYKKDTGIPESMIVNVPSRQYGNFVKDLKDIGVTGHPLKMKAAGHPDDTWVLIEFSLDTVR